MKYLSISLITIITLLLASVPSYGQEPNLIVNHVATLESADQVKLQVYFTPVEQTGRPAIELNLDETGSVQLLGEGMGIAEAKVHKPNEPIYITLLLDASGSMAPLMAQVQAAAISSLEHAPANAYFAVIQFNDVPPTAELRLPRDFTADRNLVAKDIRDVQAEAGAPTCLYNATDKAIEMLRKTMKPEQRGAVILFTDGRDQRQDPTQPCSNRTLEDVTYSAVGVAGIDIPVHTIGLCTDDSCSNLDQTALSNLAKGTIGFVAIGNQTNLSSMFEQIMAGLNSQWLATATVYPRKGRNDAVLKVRTSDQNPLEFTTSFAFNSTIDTLTLPPPVKGGISSVKETPTADGFSYEFSISATSANLSSIKYLAVEIVDAGNQRVYEKLFKTPEVDERDEFTQLISVDDSILKPGEYAIRLWALDLNRKPILTQEGEEFVESPYIRKAPPSTQVPTFEIGSVKADLTTNELVIPLYNIEKDVDLFYQLDFEGPGITPENSIKREWLKGEEIRVPLPNAMRNLAQLTEFKVYVTLSRNDEAISSEPQVKPFNIEPITPPSLLDQIREWVQKNWMWLLFILSFALMIFLWQMIKKRRQERENAKIVRPERNPPTQVATTGEATTTRRLPPTTGGTAKQITPHLLLQTCEGGSQTKPLEQELSHFPCVLGRNEKLIHGRLTPLGKRYYLNLLGDAKISRLHVEIRLQGGQFYVTDLKSRNKTKLNGQYLEPETPMQINGLSELQIGPDTRLEIHTFL